MQQEMIFVHDYARSVTRHRVIYIEYIEGKVHAVTTDDTHGQAHFDFEPDCKEGEMYMYYHSGGGGAITGIQAPHFVEGAEASYWLHPEASFQPGTDAINATRLDKPIEYNGSPNPFDNGREIYGQDYCKFCEKMYDEEACPDHHQVNDEGELEYTDGSPADS